MTRGGTMCLLLFSLYHQSRGRNLVYSMHWLSWLQLALKYCNLIFYVQNQLLISFMCSLLHPVWCQYPHWETRLWNCTAFLQFVPLLMLLRNFASDICSQPCNLCSVLWHCWPSLSASDNIRSLMNGKIIRILLCTTIVQSSLFAFFLRRAT